MVGYARRGQTIAVDGLVPGTGCPADQWYRVSSGGYACATREFRASATEIDDPVPLRNESLAFDYAKVIHPGAPRFRRLPSAEEYERAMDTLLQRGRIIEPIGSRMEGAYFVALVDFIEHEGHRFYKTYRADYIRAEDIELIEEPRGAGATIEHPESEIPFAFVQSPDTKVHCFCEEEQELVECGAAEKWTRFSLASTALQTINGQQYVETDAGQLLPRDHVRVVDTIDRPREIAKHDRWIHIRLSEQTLVAYEGDTPKLATMVSTGIPGRSTPTGTWEVHYKYVAKTMRGPDDTHGSYTVSQVPWTMFYDGPYAVHGAYWHNEFGQVRSHGCTNVPPVDARWLFDWGGTVPPGWFADSRGGGPWIHVTR